MLKQIRLKTKYLILKTQLLKLLLLLLKRRYQIQPKKTTYNHNTKITEIENEITTDCNNDKYVTIQEYSKLTTKGFTARLAEVNLIRKQK